MGKIQRPVPCGGIKCEYFKKFPTDFFIFGQDLLRDTYIVEKNIVSRFKHFLKVIPASKTPCERPDLKPERPEKPD